MLGARKARGRCACSISAEREFGRIFGLAEGQTIEVDDELKFEIKETQPPPLPTHTPRAMPQA